ncbi:DUF721 domain-containing protein [Roseospirillum parvum]|uniref:DUF721 domain-containing protein n=1 Tax=Roseospirillum parvum TaxID=83401 RepID=A0A1G8CQS9_9PROT|nr:DciA family protein [Roseospirillum parvum]SDH47539.1 hypothetical protein SAMN05421742_10768 [Roseospirillum parvum]
MSDPTTVPPRRTTGTTLAGPRALSAISQRLTRPLMRKRGLSVADLKADWPAMVGPDLARLCLPLRLSFPRGEKSHGTLTVAVTSGAVATLLEHRNRQIIERVNTYLGRPALARLAFRQGGITPPRPAPPPPVPSPAAEARLRQSLADLPDGPVKEALGRLGRTLAARDQR